MRKVKLAERPIAKPIDAESARGRRAPAAVGMAVTPGTFDENATAAWVKQKQDSGETVSPVFVQWYEEWMKRRRDG